MLENIFVVAGGTGGHINAALSVGDIFKDEYQINYLSGTRYLDYQLFKNKNCEYLASRPLRTKNPITLVKNLLLNMIVFIKIIFMYLKKKPKFIIGAGGYVCGPTLLAGKLLGIPIFIIEQNAVAGLTNRLLSKISLKVFTNFEKTKGLEGLNNILVAGNPIRAQIRPSKIPSINDYVQILVFGGSLGATQINSVMTKLLKDWSGEKLRIIHQVGKGNLKNEVSNQKIEYIQTEYIDDMNKEYEKAHIIISRAGASTISELRVVKRPSILIPYPAATDNHQWYNAQELKQENLSFIEVFDPKLDEDELYKSVKTGIEKIIVEQKFYQNELDEVPATEKIKLEINKYVRSK